MKKAANFIFSFFFELFLRLSQSSMIRKRFADPYKKRKIYGKKVRDVPRKLIVFGRCKFEGTYISESGYRFDGKKTAVENFFSRAS